MVEGFDGGVGTAGGVELILGPPNAGKLGYVQRWWMSHRSEAPLIVVPTSSDVQLVVQELAHAAGPLLGPPPAATFRSLCQAVTRTHTARPFDRRVLGPVEERMIVAEACRRFLPAGDDLSRLAGGGTTSMVRLLEELAESGVEPGEMAAGLRAWARHGGGRLASSLACVVDGLWSLMAEAGVGLEADLVRHAAASVVSWRRPVACYGFVSFTPAQRLLLSGLARKVPVLLSLTHDPDHRWGEYFATEIGHWEGIARAAVHLTREHLAFSSPEVAALEAGFLAVESPPWGARARGVTDTAAGSVGQPAECAADPGVGGAPSEGSGAERALAGVRFILASGRRAEAELVAGEIADLLREGLCADDIGVLVRETGPWHRLLGRVFGAFGIPHRIDCERVFGETAFGSALLSGVTGVAEAKATPLLAYLRSPYCEAPPHAVDLLGILLRDTRTSEGQAMLSEVRAGVPEAAREVRAVLAASPGGGRTVDLTALRRLAVRALASAARYHAWDSSEFAEDARAFDALNCALDEVSWAVQAGWTGGDRPRSREDGGSGETRGDRAPLDLVVRVLRERTVPGARSDESGVVQVMSIHRARARRFQVVFLLGLVDGEFPRGERPPLLITAEQRAAANRAAGRPLFSEPPSGEEPALFALALSRPWQLLYLCARDAEDGGEEVFPSPFWSEARRLMGDAHPLIRRTLNQIVWPLENAPSAREYLRSAAAAGVVLPGTMGLRLRDAAGSWECDPGRLKAAVALSRLGARDVFSVTELEQYSQCPFAWFLSRLVRPDGVEGPADPAVLGQILHAALRDLYSQLAAEGLVPLRAENVERARAVARDSVKEVIAVTAPPGSSGEIRLLEWRAWERVGNALDLDASSGGALVPFELELNLPREGVDIGGVRIRGRIDRVDSDPHAELAFVIDYKSGGDASAPRFGEPGAMQVPLYLLALRRLYPERIVSGGAYGYLAKPSSRGAVLADTAALVGGWASSKLSADEMEAVLDKCRLTALAAAEGIRSGLIPGTDPSDCPGYCDLQPLCRRTDRRRRW